MYKYIDINTGTVSDSINTFFTDFTGPDESIAVFSPHDDDGIIGASYAIRAALNEGANVYVVIFCAGNAGYSSTDQRNTIVGIRKTETLEAYQRLGISKDHVIRMDYSDFSVCANMGWHVAEGMRGSFEPMIRFLREHKITRLLVPNDYREHADHTAVNYIGSYDAPQAGDPILVDWAEPCKVRSVATYSVWADLSPEDAIVHGRSTQLRANRLILLSEEEEKFIDRAISAYASQGEIIQDMIRRRQNRRTKSGMYVETYLLFDPRPILDYAPYVALAEDLMGGREK